MWPSSRSSNTSGRRTACTGRSRTSGWIRILCSVSFKAPGYTADAFIDRATGSYDLTVTRMGLVAILNDLHKGRDSGPQWKLLIDLSAALLTFVSLSGLVLIYFIHKHRFAGLMSLAGGGTIVYLVYALMVP